MATVHSQSLDELEPSIHAMVAFGGGVDRGDTEQLTAYQPTDTLLLSHMAGQRVAGGAR
jgi:hypothetical protein